MKEDKLSDLSMQLSVDVLKLTKELKAKHETVISNQIGRSATSVCANIAESKYGHSRADFIAKLEIALKEANETGKWLELLLKTDYIDEATYKSIDKTCSTIRILLIASIKTAKSKLKVVQGLMKEGDERAAAIYDTIGAYFGYAIAYYAEFYSIKHVLIMGRVTSGEGGVILLERAKEVLNTEFPELAKQIKLHIPDENSRRVGQSVAAASLPKIN